MRLGLITNKLIEFTFKQRKEEEITYCELENNRDSIAVRTGRSDIAAVVIKVDCCIDPLTIPLDIMEELTEGSEPDLVALSDPP